MMLRSWPIASDSGKPNMAAAAAFQLWMTPSFPAKITASGACSTSRPASASALSLVIRHPHFVVAVLTIDLTPGLAALSPGSIARRQVLGPRDGEVVVVG